jgi:hypothetical protein
VQQQAFQPSAPQTPSHEVEAAAELSAKYRGVVEQNRELYNQVQDLKGAIRVFCRIRCGWRAGSAACLARAAC